MYACPLGLDGLRKILSSIFLVVILIMKFINKIPEYDESKNMINDKKTIMHK